MYLESEVYRWSGRWETAKSNLRGNRCLKKPHDKGSYEVPKSQMSRQNLLNMFQFIFREFLFLTIHIVMV